MNTRQSAQTARDRKTSFFRNRISSLFLQMLALFAAISLSGSLAHAANIIQNPSFEANSGYGYFGSGTIPSMPGNWTWGSPGNGGWWMQASDPGDNPHSGNNYFKEWGAYAANITTNDIYQDNACGAGATYTCDFWQGSTSDAFGNPDRFCWGQVMFYDASGNLLALYQAAPYDVSYAGSFISTTNNNWFHFYVTNQCDVVSGAVTGSVSVLTAPAGAHTIRFNWGNWQSANYDGGNFGLDDVNLNQTGGPVAPLIAQVYPGNMLFASNHISFHVTSSSSTPISTSDIQLTVNGVDVSGSCSFIGSSPDISVSYTGVPDNAWSNTASITAKDSLGLTAPPISFTFDTIHPAFVWEAEDYDYTNAVSGGGGLYINNPTPTSTPQPNSYFGLEGDSGIDYYTSSGPYSTLFRPLDARNVGVTGDYPRQQYLDAQVSDATASDWEIDNINSGDWGNYTRSYPAGTFNVYARVSGNGGTETKLSLDNIVGGAVANNVGNFDFIGEGWGVWQYVPLIDSNNNLLPLTFGGVQTLRATLTPVGGLNENFFFLVPAATGTPFFSSISPSNGQVFATGNTLSFTVTSTTVINSSGIQIILNGQDVTANPGTTIIGGTTATASCALLQSNTQYTAVLNVTNSAGLAVHRTIVFDTMSAGNFYVKMMDYDFDGGSYDTAGNGLVPYAYTGLDAVTNIDYTLGYGVNNPYRGSDGLHQENCFDVLLPGYTAGNDWDIGNYNAGQWANYTRNYPAGKYLVYGRLAGYAMNTTLSKVTAGWGTTSQTVQQLGTWVANPGGWTTWTWVELMNNGAPVVLTLGGTNTLRVTSAGNCNANYFMLVPVKTINISATTSGGFCVVSYPTLAGSTYRVLYTTSLTSPVSWTLLSTVTGDGTVKSAQTPLKGTAKFLEVVSP